METNEEKVAGMSVMALREVKELCDQYSDVIEAQKGELGRTKRSLVIAKRRIEGKDGLIAEQDKHVDNLRGEIKALKERLNEQNN